MILDPWVFILFSLDFALAQTTTTNCRDDFDWAINDLQQTPCLVSAFLAQQCSPETSYNVPSLRSNEMYLPPTGQQANACQCSSVYYSLLSACSQCQQANLDTFTMWTSNCPFTNISMQTYPMATPNGTQIPAWAFLPLSNGRFDLQSAGKNATNNPNFGQSQGELSTGAIIGLTAGCVIALLLFVVALWLYLRMRTMQRIQAESQQTPAVSERPGLHGLRYGKIEGPPRKPHTFLARSAAKVVSYRPGLNFDLDKGRRGDLLELSESTRLRKSREHSNEASIDWGSAGASKTSLDSRQSKRPEHHSEPGIAYPISNMFSRAKEVKPQRGEGRLDLAESSAGGASGGPSSSNSDTGDQHQDQPPRLSGGRRPVLLDM